MKDLEYEREKLKKVEEELEEIQEGEEQILATLPKKYGNNPVLLSNLMSSTATKITNIAKIKEKPYFARLDFKEDKKDNKDKLYIGKIGVIDLDGKIVITDWRAPVATLYYDSNLGKVEYNAPEGSIKGELSLKRQIIIKNKEVQDIFDVDSVSDDELLKPYLGANADNRLKNIVASIQGEQNYIIRKDIEKNLIVQGVAGSGKTTVALHRIAYLMYNNSTKFKPNQFMVIGPNKFFINYISNVLPDLDASNAVQVTFEELASNFVNEKLVFEDATKKLSDIIDGKEDKNYLKFKSSMKYKKILDKYLNTLKNNLISDTGLVINNVKILSKEDVMNVFNETIGTSISERLEMAAKIIANRIKNDHNVYQNIKDQMLILEKAESNVENKRKIAKKELDMLKELTSTGFEKQLKKYVSISNLKVLNIYKEFVENVDKYTSNIDNVDIEKMKKDTLDSLKAKVIENEDIAAIMYIKYVLFGNEEYRNFKCVIVDEAQDFGKFSYYMLKTLLNNAVFSIFGDMAQGIYSYRSIDDWNEIMGIFNGAEFLRLEKSYRTSIEIMNEANKISQAMELGKAIPVIRNAGPTIKSKVEKNKQQDYIVSRVKEYLDMGFKSIAVVYKNQKNMINLNKKFKENNIESEIIYKDQEKYNGGVCIVTSYLSKGLEFDVVIVADAEDENYDSSNKLDMKLLYVAMTRALHKLEFVYDKNICKYLKD
ncbi:MAG: UvrD-helicase domain-containing protein [Clostridia bacterium]|nr:UvrD-helicase domain-containing protein [Clostridia bacterium]